MKQQERPFQTNSMSLLTHGRLQLLWLLQVLLASSANLAAVAQAPLENDICEGSIDLTPFAVPLGSSGTVIQGSTVDSTPEDLDLCGVTAASKSGIWYHYQNSLDDTIIVTASTCTDQTNFDTALTLYEGGGCDERTCVHGVDNDTECGTGDGEHTTLSWHATSKMRYYLLVHGSLVNHTGDFGLTITTETPLESPPVGDSASQGDKSSQRIFTNAAAVWAVWVISILLNILL